MNIIEDEIKEIENQISDGYLSKETKNSKSGHWNDLIMMHEGAILDAFCQELAKNKLLSSIDKYIEKVNI